MNDKNEQIFSKGCLTPDKHGPLVAEIDKFAAVAGLGGANKRYIWEPLEKYNLSDMEVTVLKGLKQLSSLGKGGVIYVGQKPAAIADRLMALTGCMVRNYVDARFTPLEHLITEYKEQRCIAAEVACVPNLHTEATCLQAWQKSLLSDLLLHHMSEGKLIFGYVQNPTKMQADYPAAIHDLLKSRFYTIGETP